MGDAAGQLADRLHLLGLAKRVLGVGQFGLAGLVGGQVAAHGDEVLPVRLGRDRPIDRLPRPVLGQDAVLEAGGTPGPAHLLQRRDRGRHVPRIDDVGIGVGQQFMLAPAENLGPRRIHRRHVTPVVGAGQHVGRQAPESIAFVGLGLLLGDVATAAIDHAVFRHTHPRDPSIAAVLAAIAVGEADRRLALLGQVETRLSALDVVGVQQFEDRQAGDLLLGPAQRRFPGGVGRFEIALRIERAEQVGADLPGQAARLGALDDLALEVGIEFAQAGLALAQRRVGLHPLGRFDHRADHARRSAALVEHRPVVQVHPDLFRRARAVQGQFLVLVGQGSAVQADLHDVVVEVGHLGPALADIAAQ